MAEKSKKPTETGKKKENIEREYIIPLREKCRVVPRYKKTNKAIKTIKEFLVQHMKVRDRDLDKIKLDKYLNEFVWARGIRHPPHKVKVKAISDGEIIRVELVDFPEKLKFKKAREEKREKKAEEAGKAKKATEKVTPDTSKEEDTKPNEGPSAPAGVPSEEDKEKKNEEKEKKAAVVEAGEKMEKAAAKQAKHQTGGKNKQPKRQVRKALAK